MPTRNKKLYISVSVALLSGLLSLPSNANSGAPITFLAQDSQPKYFFSKKRLEGLCIDIYRALEVKLAKKQIKVEYPTQFMPIKRIFSLVETEPQAVFCGAAKSASRELRFNFTTIPAYPVNYVLATHRDNTVAPNSFEQIQQGDYTIGAFYGTSSAREMKQVLGEHRVNDSFTDLDMAMKLLGTPPYRLQYFYYHDIGLHYIVKRSSLPLKVLPIKFTSKQHWLIYSKLLAPAQAEALEQAMVELKKEGKLDKIIKQYSN